MKPFRDRRSMSRSSPDMGLSRGKPLSSGGAASGTCCFVRRRQNFIHPRIPKRRTDCCQYIIKSQREQENCLDFTWKREITRISVCASAGMRDPPQSSQPGSSHPG